MGASTYPSSGSRRRRRRSPRERRVREGVGDDVPERAHGAESILNAHVRLYLVRHAHSDPGQPDELRPLSTKGREQARALAEQLAEARPELVLTSPLLRARRDRRGDREGRGQPASRGRAARPRRHRGRRPGGRRGRRRRRSLPSATSPTAPRSPSPSRATTPGFLPPASASSRSASRLETAFEAPHQAAPSPLARSRSGARSPRDRRAARARRPSPRNIAAPPLAPLAAATHELRELVGGNELAEEKLEQPLVPHVVLLLGRREPLVERPAPLRRQTVDAAANVPARLLARADEACSLQPSQLRIDLPVARAPEEPRRAVGDLLDVVTGPGRRRPAGRGSRARSELRVDISGRYILTYLADMSNAISVRGLRKAYNGVEARPRHRLRGRGPARCSASSARTAPGRRRRSRSSRATGSATPARSRCSATTRAGWRRRSASESASSSSTSELWPNLTVREMHRIFAGYYPRPRRSTRSVELVGLSQEARRPGEDALRRTEAPRSTSGSRSSAIPISSSSTSPRPASTRRRGGTPGSSSARSASSARRPADDALPRRGAAARRPGRGAARGRDREDGPPSELIASAGGDRDPLPREGRDGRCRDRGADARRCTS